MKKTFVQLFTICLLGILPQPSFSQLSILNSSMTAFNVTPNGLCQLTVMNPSTQVTVMIEAQLLNSANQQLLKVTTTPFVLKQGVSSIQPHQYGFSSIVYSGINQGKYLKSHNKLPSGNYQYCVRIRVINNSEDVDDYCIDVDATDQSFLYLVFPEDGEELETVHPVLMWMHSEPFNVLSQGEFFRMVVVELSKGQGPEAGIVSNAPIYVQNYLSRHQSQYPFDAKELEHGKRYGWQVQKISNGNIVATSEAWEFVLTLPNSPKDHMYTSLKKDLDGGFYTVKNDRIFFRFDERYNGISLTSAIYDEKNQKIEPSVKSQLQGNAINSKVSGHNQYELDLEPYDLKEGYYLLQVTNEKQQEFKLKFYVN